MQYAIETRRLSKHYGAVRAVDDVDLKVLRGSIHGVLGPNGAGKSTLIGILGTLVRPTGGSAVLEGIDVMQDPMSVRRRIGFAMQEAGVDHLATAEEYLVLQARLYGLKKRIATSRASELLEIFNLKEVRHKRIGGFSGGMKRRIDLAAALIHAPPVLFLDEPSEGLDPKSREQLWDLLEHLNKKTGMTILLSTHYMEEADRLCDKISILDRGRILTEGTPQELKVSVGGQSLLLAYDKAHARQVDIAERSLRDNPDIQRIQRTNNTLHVFVQDAASSTPAILGRLETIRATPQTLRIREPTLNDVYLNYTGRRYEEAD